MNKLFENNFRLTDSDTLKFQGIKYNSLISRRNGITMFHRNNPSIKKPSSCCLCKDKLETDFQLHRMYHDKYINTQIILYR